ncbi:MAG: hypothetical protein R3A80_04740 [Bdellovibrionota bacterium]
MQFLFVVLMSVLVGASALPHLLQAPSRPSFSLRKSSSSNLVAIPKFFEKVAFLEKKLLELEAQQLRKLKELQDKQNGAQEEVEEEADLSEDTVGVASIPEEGDRNIASYVGPKGVLHVENIDLRACICSGEHMMKCQLWVEGYCSEVDDFIQVVVKTPSDPDDLAKSFRCKELNTFSGIIPIAGQQSIRVRVSYRNQNYRKDLSLLNHCGPFGDPVPTEDE